MNLQTIIENKINTAFVPEYRSEAKAPEALGLVIAEYHGWDGVKILQTAISALEDANFHTEAAAVQELLDNL